MDLGGRMEKKNMDHYLRRLKQELLSMKEVGEGLHEQMNCMMGALQELKLLQVQTALEQLEISSNPNQVSGIGEHQYCQSKKEVPRLRHEASRQSEKLLGKSSLESGSSAQMPQPTGPLYHIAFPHSTHGHMTSSLSGSISSDNCCRASGPPSTVSTAEYHSPRTLESSSEHMSRSWFSHDTSSLSESKFGCQECQFSDETNDWTSSLMSQSRNRQPLVLGDNIFADLVGNWLDLPEIDKKGEKSETLSGSKSQEFYRKFSLTANIFKKFLRSVRPDRDRLLKEKPCWLPTEDKEAEILKRPKKVNKQKGTFYFPVHGNISNTHDKAERCQKKETSKAKTRHCAKKTHNAIDHNQSGFDFNTAVWV